MSFPTFTTHTNKELNEQDLEPEQEEDMNLAQEYGQIEDEALLPSMFNDVSFMYETIRGRIPPDEMKPDSQKRPKGNLNWTAIALTHLLLLLNPFPLWTSFGPPFFKCS
jgi:hypothetical protein